MSSTTGKGRRRSNLRSTPSLKAGNVKVSDRAAEFELFERSPGSVVSEGEGDGEDAGGSMLRQASSDPYDTELPLRSGEGGPVEGDEDVFNERSVERINKTPATATTFTSSTAAATSATAEAAGSGSSPTARRASTDSDIFFDAEEGGPTVPRTGVDPGE
eukprot:gene17727-7074_t